MVKFLLEDVQRARERRNEHVRFVTAILADLKSVYDRVERVRVLIVAHRSALTYGKEMRDLIDSAVQLRNVQRALDQTTSNISEPDRGELVGAVGTMEAYLNSLAEEFKEYYKPIADKQRIYEAAFEHFLKQTKPGATPPDNPAWQELQGLVKLRGFRPASSSEFRESESSTDESSTAYKRKFIDELDRAASILRGELNRISGGSNPKVPQEHKSTQDSLASSD